MQNFTGKIERTLDRLDKISVWKLFILAILIGWGLAALDGIVHNTTELIRWIIWK